MRPSISVSLEPGLDRGVPWGRDLYTFVTSAAGHMMRTLQKPRKNRPSKRQVNHRRFLHNMIQRWFADIEAANHRLAAALYFKESDKDGSSPSWPKPESPEPTGSTPQSGTDPEKHNDDVSVNLYEAEVGEKKQQESGHLWKRHPKNQNKPLALGSDFNQESGLFDSKFQPISSFLEENQSPPDDSSFGQSVSPTFSPELSPLSLESCDFSVQMFSDLPVQRSLDLEAQLTDILELLGDPDTGSWMDMETYLESICDCHGDTGPEDQSESFAEADGGEGGCGYGCHGDQGQQSSWVAEEELHNQLPVCYQENQCMMGNRGIGFTLFEGVAQSFNAPMQTPEVRLIATPPQENDWLFTDILKDRKSPEY
uniref:SERTA domain-containing protein n=1 Tax=Amphiprion ocellaris TaxID=80972 RepID=A0AAQ5YZ07_AMPOC